MNNYIKDYYDIWFAMNELYETWAKTKGLTSNSLFMLYVIANSSECTQMDICKKLFLPKQTVNSILKGFEEMKYVKKTISKSDKRNKIITFTKLGKGKVNEILTELKSFEEKALSTMGETEKQGLIETNFIFLKKLQETFNLKGEL